MTTYLQGHHASVLRSHRWRTAANSAGYLLPHVRQRMRVLDVGCGPGTITRDLGALVGPQGEVVGVDNSPEVVAQAAKECDLPQVRFAVEDARNLDAGDGTRDVVHAHQVLQHLTDPVSALREMARVSRPGGLAAVRDVDYAAMTWYPAVPALDRWLEDYRATARAHDAEPDAGRRLLGWAHAAGFAEITASASAWCFATAEDRDWWGAMQADRIVHSRIAGEAVHRGLCRADELPGLAAGWRTWAAADDGWFAVLHGELLCRVAA